MTCHEIQHLLSSLHRDELTVQELGELNTHLDSCKSCLETAREYSTAEDFLQALRHITPELTNPRVIHRHIMNEIRDAAGRRSGIDGALELFVGWFDSRSRRILLVSALSIMVLAFLLQGVSLFVQLRHLEAQFATTNARKGHVQTEYGVRTTDILHTDELQRALNALPNDWKKQSKISIRKSDVESYIRMLERVVLTERANVLERPISIPIPGIIEHIQEHASIRISLTTGG